MQSSDTNLFLLLLRAIRSINKQRFNARLNFSASMFFESVETRLDLRKPPRNVIPKIYWPYSNRLRL